MTIKSTQEWESLTKKAMPQMLSLFEQDKKRFEKLSIKFNQILFDYSKNLVDDDILSKLLALTKTVGLPAKIEAMFSGDKINFTEKRAVLHTALRQQSDNPVYVAGKDIIPDVKAELHKMEIFVAKVHSGEICSITGEKFTNIVNIGIGGSDLGPAMIAEALQDYVVRGIAPYFVSNVDGTDIYHLLQKINPNTTLFIVASKTFTTQETLTNAIAAKEWLLEKTGNNAEAVAKHFIALSTNTVACEEFGINRNNIFCFWDWVGGRYSLWSSIGLSIALSIGMGNFRKLLIGANEADEHFRHTSFEKNIPVLMALLGIWYIDFGNMPSHCVVPYEQNLSKFPAFLQQLDMESNGKYVNTNNECIDYNTAPIVWGAAGTNAQHSFFQLLHQGTQVVPADFIAFVKTNVHGKRSELQHKILLSNFFAQTEALMKGKNAAEVLQELTDQKLDADEIKKLLPHKIFTGNRPTNSFLIEELTPETLGSLVAFYEHKVFVQGCIWQINSFDQWGVELGKQLAKKILPELDTPELISSHDTSTNGLINAFKKINNK